MWIKVLFLTIYSAVGHSDRHGGAHARQGGPRAPDAVRLRQTRSAINTGTGTRLHKTYNKRILYLIRSCPLALTWQITSSLEIRREKRRGFHIWHPHSRGEGGSPKIRLKNEVAGILYVTRGDLIQSRKRKTPKLPGFSVFLHDKGKRFPFQIT